MRGDRQVTSRGRVLIASSVIRRIESLLRERHTQRAIAKMLGVGRNTVGRVAAGLVTSASRAAQEQLRQARPAEPREVPAYRCRKCGGRYNVRPCPKCLLLGLIDRDGQQAASRRRDPPAAGVDLKPEHASRYQEVRRWRREANRRRA